MEKAFTDIYQGRRWSFLPGTPSSGTGSKVDKTYHYRLWLTTFIKQNDIKSIVDFGCGDWTFTQYLDLKDIDYLGVDIYADLIKSNTLKYGRDNIKFMHADLTLADSVLPKADLWIIKDVFQHWPNSYITDFLTRLREDKSYKYIIITNCSTDGPVSDIPIGGFRRLNLKAEPLLQFKPILIAMYDSKKMAVITDSPFVWKPPVIQETNSCVIC